MSADLPPIGSRVRLINGRVGEVETAPDPMGEVYVAYKPGGTFHLGWWVTADEIEEVLTDASDGD